MISGWSANETDTTESCLINSLRLISEIAVDVKESKQLTFHRDRYGEWFLEFLRMAVSDANLY